VPNLRQADARWECTDPENTALEEWVLIVTLKDGREIRTRPFIDGGPLPLEPAAAVIEQMSDAGPPQTLRVLTAVVETNENGTTPTTWSLAANYPNPFNSGTIIPFTAATAVPAASLRIYNLQGQLVRTLFAGPITAGYREVRWDGNDDDGLAVASGAYFYNLTTDKNELKRKLLLLR
jgi:hypothetical protein